MTPRRERSWRRQCVHLARCDFADLRGDLGAAGVGPSVSRAVGLGVTVVRRRSIVSSRPRPTRSRKYSASVPSSSVGNGPAPTRLVNAFTTPITRPIAAGPTPEPTHAAAATQLLEVPYG